MNEKTLYLFEIWQICIFFFAGMIFFAFLGFKVGKKERVKFGTDETGFVSSRAGMITLLSLLLGFTFSMSSDRYRDYKIIMINEVNSIGSASLQAELYPEPYRSEFRKYFKEYIDERISFYDAGTDLTKIDESKKKSGIAGKNLWELSSRLFQDSLMINASRLMTPSLNKMFDAAVSREANLKSKVPYMIALMILLTAFVVFYFGGYGSTHFSKKEFRIFILYAAIITLVVYNILDLDRPDSGLIKPTAEQEALIELRENFNDDK